MELDFVEVLVLVRIELDCEELVLILVGVELD